MSLELDVVIDSPVNSVDMKTGLSTLQGASDAARCIAEAVLTEKTPKRQTHKGKVRTSLKKSFTGSYGHIFSIEIYDNKLRKKFKSIGQTVFSELIAYFLSESLYLDSKLLSEEAQVIVDNLGDTAEEIEKQLRISALNNLHKASTTFNHDVKIRFRARGSNPIVLAKLNQTTAEVLKTTESKKEDLTIRVTRLNIYTGNGRLVVQDENETVAFGFSTEYKRLPLDAKKGFSTNLHHNNGLGDDDCHYLKISAKALKLRDGKIVKYIITGLFE